MTRNHHVTPDEITWIRNQMGERVGSLTQLQSAVFSVLREDLNPTNISSTPMMTLRQFNTWNGLNLDIDSTMGGNSIFHFTGVMGMLHASIGMPILNTNINIADGNNLMGDALPLANWDEVIRNRDLAILTLIPNDNALTMIPEALLTIMRVFSSFGGTIPNTVANANPDMQTSLYWRIRNVWENGLS